MRYRNRNERARRARISSKVTLNILLQNKIITALPRIEEWLLSLEKDAPLYMSADIRDAEFKIASIDANLYPAGFNNLDSSFYALAVKELKAALSKKNITQGAHLLLVSEEHTRNLFYLENIHVLKTLLENAGYKITVTTAFELEGALYANTFAHLQSASGNIVSLLNPTEAKAHLNNFSAIVMNHDSSAGTPQWLQETSLPTLPTWRAGWHTRSKARHFFHYANLAAELGKIVGVDPWFLSPLGTRIAGIDINEDISREKVAHEAEVLLKEIQKKYTEYHITEKPFVFLKSDHGTYGMAMLSFDNASEIKEINRKEKNKLFKGKSSVVVKNYLVQEGVPTTVKDGAYFAESVVMLANNHFIGKFARVNEQKDARSSLNSTGMFFKPIPLSECGDDATKVATLITRMAGIALQREIEELNSPNMQNVFESPQAR
ncbi:MAG: hypothetical protein LDLANPLL_00677 [Turneriella sp.]|nr:hypothetical protein [Turneriella sp.]